jgi:regulator of protease activity HflC (stomatin/prohibitin superfamily)
MFWFIIAIVLLVIAVGVFFGSRAFNKNEIRNHGERGLRVTPVWALLPAALAVIAALVSAIYTQSVGQASVVVNAGGTIAGQNIQPGFAVKAPWQTLSRWDLFSQSVTYAGDASGAPSYTGGQVSGASVTTAVAGGAQSDFDLSVVYSLDGDKVEELFRKYRSQERFTKQVIEPSILAVVRDVPSAYTPVQFRGEKRGEAQDFMLTRLNERLDEYGVSVTLVNLQNITFTAEVEESIKAVEVAQQEQAKAEANLRATEISAQAQIVEAEAKAKAAVAEAEGQAKANDILTKSLTDKVLQQKWIDAIRDSNGTIVVPDGAAPLINLSK